MLSLYYGSGKGKTCSAIGVAVRAAAKDKKVLFVDFIKNDSESITNALSTIYNITLITAPVELELPADAAVENKAQLSKVFRELFDCAVRTVLTSKYDMLVLDGAFDAVSKGLLPETEVHDFLSNAPDSLDVICTGIIANEKFFTLFNNITELTDKTDK